MGYRYYNRSGVTRTVPGPNRVPVTVRNGEYVTGDWFARFASFDGPNPRKALVAEYVEDGRSFVETDTVSPKGDIVSPEVVEEQSKVSESVVEKETSTSETVVSVSEIGDTTSGVRISENELMNIGLDDVKRVLNNAGIDVGEGIKDLETKKYYVRFFIGKDDYYVCRVCEALLRSYTGTRRHLSRRHGVNLGL